MLVTRVHPRIGRLLLVSLCYTPGCFAGIFTVVYFNHPEIMLRAAQAGSPVPGVLMIAGVVGVYGLVLVGLFMGLFAAVYGLERWLGRTTLQQTGLICWACGYNLGAPSITVCPECGRAFDPSRPPRVASLAFLQALTHRARLLLAVTVVTAIGLCVYVLATNTVPCFRFLSACPATGQLQWVMVSNWVTRGSGTTTTFVHPLDTGWWLPDPDAGSSGFSVQLLPGAHADEPTMFISRACRLAMSPVGPPGAELVSIGSINVHARLSRSQAAEVIAAHRVPQSLLDAIRREAEDASWKEAPYSTPPTGEKRVDPAPYFGSAAGP
jgi:hypothetical protein